MAETADLLITQASELITADGASDDDLTAEAMLGLIRDGAVAIGGDRVLAVGTTVEIRDRFKLATGGREISAHGCTVAPGFVDPHAHPVFAGSREQEFEYRLQGMSYMEIAARGGGIRSTVAATRAATAPELQALTRRRLDTMLLHGTTTAEAKSGYGLDTATEVKMLEVIRALDASHPVDLVPTFLGAHEFPAEYHGDHDGYVDLLVEEMIPAVRERELAEFCDVFCEEGVFTVDQSRRVLAAGRLNGLTPRLHADEFAWSGGAELAAEIHASSADHLGAVSGEGLRAMKIAGVVPVLLPGTTFHLAIPTPAPARDMIDLGMPVALGTDFNPGSSPSESLQMTAALAAVYLRMSAAEIMLGITRNAALALRREEDIGRIAPGGRADVVILDLPNHRHLPYHYGVNHVIAVVKNGRVVVEQGRLRG